MPFTSVNVQNSKSYSLSQENNVLKSNVFQSSSSSCFQGFFYLETLQKTGIATPCTTSSTDDSLPNCNTGRYGLCACRGVNNNDCSNCDHKGYIPLVSMNDKVILLEVLGAPDASRQGKASVQLCVKTQSSGSLEDSSGNPLNPEKYPKDPTGRNIDDLHSGVYIETFVLPPIPFQKWIMITINREGRRFDIYYNDVLVLSKLTSAPIYPTTISDAILVGNQMINGSTGFFSIYNTSQTASFIQNQYKTLTNTRGSPLFNEAPSDIAFTKLSLDRLSTGVGLPSLPSLCENGDCITSPSMPPSKPFYDWETNYS